MTASTCSSWRVGGFLFFVGGVLEGGSYLGFWVGVVAAAAAGMTMFDVVCAIMIVCGFGGGFHGSFFW